MRIRGLAAALAASALVAALVTPADASPLVAEALGAGSRPLTVEGTVVKVADSPDTSAYLVMADDTAIALTGDQADALPAGAEVEATLLAPEDVTDVEELVEGAEPVEIAAVLSVEPVRIAAAGVSSGKTRYVDVAVNLKARYTQPTNAQIATLITQVSNYWRANTHNEFGPLEAVQLNFKRYNSKLKCDQEDHYAWAQDAAKQFGKSSNSYVTAPASGNPRHLILFGECTNSSALGVGTIGSGIDSGGWTSLQEGLYSSGNKTLGYAPSALAHELGHNIGLEHANAVDHEDCDITETPAFQELEWCPLGEYEDTATIMGYASAGHYSLGLLDIARRDQLGVVPGAVTTAPTGTQSFTLAPVGNSAGTRGIRITGPVSKKKYYVEYRTDTQEPNSRDNAEHPAKLVRILELDGTSTILKTSRGNLLPTDDVNRGIEAGERWQAESGDVVVTVGATADSAAQVTVTVGAALSTTTAEAPTLTSSPVPGVELTAVPGAFAPGGATVTYQWYVGREPVPGATGFTYTPSEADEAKSVRLLATVQGGAALATQAVSDQAAGYVRTWSAVVIGAARVDRSITVVPSYNVPSAAVLTYEWLRDDEPIPGADSATYVVTGADVDHWIYPRITATDGPSVFIETTIPEYVELEYFLTTALPTLTIPSKPGPGGTLTVGSGPWKPAPTAYQYRWYREDKLIAGATSSTYVISARDYGAAITAEVAPVRSGYAKEWWWVGDWAVVVGGSLNVKAPALAGPLKVGAKVTPAAGTWAYNTKLSYQWLRAGKAIKGATKSTYTPTAADRGKKLSLRVKGTHKYVPAVTKTTKTFTVGYGTLKKGVAKVSGTAKVGKTLTAKPGTWTSGTSLNYQWYANGKAIKGATKKTFKLASKQAGKTITVKVTGTKTAYSKASATSAATVKVKR